MAVTTQSNLNIDKIELGHATDTTLSRTGAGVVAVEGVNIPMVGTIITGGRTIGLTSPANATWYSDTSNSSTTETGTGNIIPFSGTIKNLYIDSYTNNINAGSTVFTLVKNGSDTTITVTVAFGVTSITGDTTHSTTVAAGDRITLKTVSTGATGNLVFSFSYQIV